jgi:SPP1 gp7 family putative phage head morphogenesis protein
MKNTANFLSAIYKGRFTEVKSEEEKFEQIINRYLRAWEAQVQNNLDKKYGQSTIYKSLFKALDPEDVAGMANFRIGDMPKRLASLGAAAANKGLRQAYTDMKLLLTWDIDMTPIAEYYLQHYTNFSNVLAQDIQDKIKKVVAESVTAGDPVNEVHKKIGEVFNQPITIKVPEKLNDVGEVIRRAYEYEMNKDSYTTTVARSEIQRALNNGRVYGYQQENIVKTLRWVVNPGACEICEEHSGQIYDIEDSQDILPAHPNCKCTFVVDTYKSYDESTDSIDKFNAENIESDPNGMGFTEMMKLNNPDVDKVLKELDKNGVDKAMKLLRKLAGGK